MPDTIVYLHIEKVNFDSVLLNAGINYPSQITSFGVVCKVVGVFCFKG